MKHTPLSPQLRMCTRCVLDTTTSLISFDENGVCNFCHDYDKEANRLFNHPKEERQKKLNSILEKIKRDGKDNKYDCIVGISGGMDSSYLAHLSFKLGLRPLLVHFDNGWNSELAVQNINNLIEKLGAELYTYVIDWEDFKELQKAYFKASVIDIEVPTDQLIFAVLFKIAKQFKIRYILEGYNFRTEFGMPLDWTFLNKFDLTNRNNIYKKFGTRKIRNIPTLSKDDLKIYDEIHKIQAIDLITYLEYNYEEVLNTLKTEYNYKPYKYKHYESIFTRFYQGYILPRKWGIDKRKAHLATRIRSGFITREKALELLSEPPYPIEEQEADKRYVLKKWDMSEEEFESIMKQPPVDHSVYGYDKEASFLTKLKIRLYYIYIFKIAIPLGIEKLPVKN